MDPKKIITIAATILIIFGFVTMAVGLIILLREALSRRISEIKDEITHMATKGLLSGLQESVESATYLVKELNSLMKTEVGAGFCLLLIGSSLIAAGIFLLNGTHDPAVAVSEIKGGL